MSHIIKDLKKRCTDEGISMNKLCMSVDVRREMISRYEKNTPIAIKVVEKLSDKLDQLKAIRLGLIICKGCGEMYANTKNACPQCKMSNLS